MRELPWLDDEVQSESYIWDDTTAINFTHDIRVTEPQFRQIQYSVRCGFNFSLTLFVKDCDSLLHEIEIEMQYARWYMAAIRFFCETVWNLQREYIEIHFLKCTPTRGRIFGDTVNINFQVNDEHETNS